MREKVSHNQMRVPGSGSLYNKDKPCCIKVAEILQAAMKTNREIAGKP